ncbi:hypothetical protein ACIRPK_12385 [Kitasatospora sp. NPDC101801]|uniref:hypothetical protein n=1 Tax=Kitasatospora sp. NPDC101801 TaxID=3364103 RepID=UPI0037FF85B1
MSRPGVVVTGLTLAALATVGLLAFQANGAATRTPVAKPATSSSAAPSPSAAASPSAPALPAASGTGRRVVYSAGSHYVWLVDPKKTPPTQSAFPVTPGSVEPTAGSYTVYSRTPAGTGTDGRQIEHVVRFAQQNNVVFGFSAALDGATPSADPKTKTGGIRSGRADSQSLWDFAQNGTKVVVIP